MRAIRINAEEAKLEVVEWETLEDLQRHVGGYVQMVKTPALPKCAVLVDEEGLLKSIPYGFRLAGYPYQPLVGNGLVVGDSGLDFGPTDVSLDVVASHVKWLVAVDQKRL